MNSCRSRSAGIVIDTVRFLSKVPPCFKCGRHKECEIGGLYMMLGDAAKELTITKEMFTKHEDDSATAAAIDAAAEKLRRNRHQKVHRYGACRENALCAG